MHQLLTPAREIRTDRLVLSPLTPADVDDVLVVLSAGGAASRVDAEHVVQESIGSRVRHGLGAWMVRSRADGSSIGIGGATMTDDGWRVDVLGVSAGIDRGLADEVREAARRELARLDGRHAA